MRGLSLHHCAWRRALRPSTPRRCVSTTKTRADRVDFPALDTKWQANWNKLGTDWYKLGKGDTGREYGRAYVLPMFPYPSGTLHLGHLRVYTISDVIARFKHLQGYRVVHPIGWDAFGLPAENAAIERGIDPAKWTLRNIESMKEQMMTMGGQWDWDREIRTCDPDFYQHTQRIFLMLHERGLAYQAESLVNYDPVDKTVLANEQVDANGCSWRSGAKVQKIMLKQWFLKIKDFQEPLLKDLDALAENGNWPESVLTMQRNWLGRSEGTKLQFTIQLKPEEVAPVNVFTTRADTIFGVQYIALSLNHPIVQKLAGEDEALHAFVQRASDFPPDSKEGYLLPNVTAQNPITALLGMENNTEPLPVYVAPYVLDDYGSGAVMGVPGHDTRDHAFWRANAGDSPIRVVVTSKPNTSPEPLVPGKKDKPMVKSGFVAANIDGFANISSTEAADEVVRRLGQSGQTVEKTENWRLRDWLISRQRYWGTPIPIIHCKSCGPVPVPNSDLPVQLPSLPDSYFKGKTGNPLAEDVEWKKATCPKCASPAERETDTMDTFMDSSWYFFRFLSPNDNRPFDGIAANEGMPVDVYIGGVEHAILHLLYARFISKFLATTDLWPVGQKVNGEPFKKLITQGMVHGKTYCDPETGRFLRPEEVDKSNPSVPVIKASGQTPTVSFEKMSKSKHNGVDPGKTIAKYGADVTRAHMLFQAPVSDVLEWDETSITGVQRWLSRVLDLSRAPFLSPQMIKKEFMPPKELDQNLFEIIHGLRKRNAGGLTISKPPQGTFKTTQEELIAHLKHSEQRFWAQTQELIASVNRSYSETHSLNTIISDLMSLTNIIEKAPRSSMMSYLTWYATVHLFRMLAPVAPAVAEECWQRLHLKTSRRIDGNVNHPLRLGAGPSIFAFGFPTADLEALRLLDTSVTCVFQVEGKRKFEAEIWKAPKVLAHEHNAPDPARWVLEQLMETEGGKEWLDKKEGKLWKISGTDEAHPYFLHIPKTWHAISAGGGKILNVVRPKTKVKKAEPGPGGDVTSSSKNGPLATEDKRVPAKWPAAMLSLYENHTD